MIFSVLAIVAMGEVVRSQGTIQEAPVDLEIFYKVLLVLLASILGVVAMLRSRWVGPAAESLRLRPDDHEAWSRWRGGNITSFVLCESMALFGLVLRLLGAELARAAPFYAVGILMLIVITPRDPANQ